MGWLVAERDRLPSPGEDPTEVGEAQVLIRRSPAAHTGVFGSTRRCGFP
ncbi:MAG: hypothetical protein ACRDOS_16295 [Gaiellaceae bacterium]